MTTIISTCICRYSLCGKLFSKLESRTDCMCMVQYRVINLFLIPVQNMFCIFWKHTMLYDIKFIMFRTLHVNFHFCSVVFFIESLVFWGVFLKKKISKFCFKFIFYFSLRHLIFQEIVNNCCKYIFSFLNL